MTKVEPAGALRPDPNLDLSITRTFDAPASVMFEIWSKQEHLLRWWGPKDSTTTHFDLDFRVGGAYRARFVHDERGESWMNGRFVEIVPEQRIVFTFAWEHENPELSMETLVTVSFAEKDGKTTQTFHQTPFVNADTRDNHIKGWTQLIDKEQGYAECFARGGPKH